MPTIPRPPAPRRAAPARLADILPPDPTRATDEPPARGRVRLELHINGATYAARIFPDIDSGDMVIRLRLTITQDGEEIPPTQSRAVHVTHSKARAFTDCDCDQTRPGRPCDHVAACEAIQLIPRVRRAPAPAPHRGGRAR